MKLSSLFLAIILFSGISSATTSNTYNVTGGFGVKNDSSHIDIPSWNRYFLSGKYGVLEIIRVFKDENSCSGFGFELESKSSRFYERTYDMNNVLILFPNNISRSDCEHFYALALDIFNRATPANPARIDVIKVNAQWVKKISVTFEGKSASFAQ
ncbi:MAG: hypothetical protein IT289_05120 [Oligoflexia bacterium]|nr:hypothetical protein [Oligoflexia bacterium]